MPKAFLLLIALFAPIPLLAESIHFKNGDVLSGRILERVPGKVRLATDNLGEVWVDATLLADDAPAPFPRGGSSPTDPEQPTPLPAAADLPHAVAPRRSGAPVWKTSLSLAARHQSAVSASTSANSSPSSPSSSTFRGSRTEVAASLTISRVTSLDAYSLAGALTYTDTDPWGPEIDEHSAEFTWTHALSAETRTMSRTSYQVDHARGIRSAAYQFGGLGFLLLDDLQTKLTVTPGLVVMYDRKGNDFDHQFHAGAGLMLSYEHLFTESLSFEHTVFLRQSVRDQAFWVLSARAGVRAALGQHTSWITGITYDYDATLGRQPSPLRNTPRPNRDSLRFDSGLTLSY